MKIYSHYGFNDFIICCGYKGHIIKEYFANYFLYQADMTIDLAGNKVDIHHSHTEPWKITLIDTGLNTMTGGRIKRIEPYVHNETFMLTYGDGLGNIDLNALLNFHRLHKHKATVTVVQPSGRFGSIQFDEKDSVKVFAFQEKPKGDGTWVNGGFFVLEPEIFDYINEGDQTIWEKSPLENLAKERQLVAYKHYGYWKPMDTLRDRNELEDAWQNNNAKWKIWE
jgi:glucose-1-phosphate cytidylyltransferase